MKLRSLLFVPGDRPDRMEKALTAGADALILDLEDSVLPERKAEARRAVADFLARAARLCPCSCASIPYTSETADADLAAVMPARPAGIVLPKAEGGASLAELDRRLTGYGAMETLILPIATETPHAIFALGSYGGVSGRLCGLSWGAEDLPAAIGASAAARKRRFRTRLMKWCGALALFGAHAAEVPAIETVYPALKDEAGLAAYAARGRRDGFSAMLALHPAQVATINAAFEPSESELTAARRIVAAFEAHAGAGSVQLDGRMLDAPHLKNALRLLR